MDRIVITGRLIDGRSDTCIENGLVSVGNGIIEYAGDAAGYTIPANAVTIRAEGRTILPGLIDCHTHLTGEKNRTGYTVFDALLTVSQELPLLLDAGFTTVRDMSLFSSALKRAQQAGQLRGPRIVAGGRLISPLGGHGDMMPELPKEVASGMNLTCCLADGVDECLKTVRMQFRDGAEFIKISATGGVSSRADGLDDVQFSDEEIAAIAAEASRHGSYVAAHCSNAAGTKQAIRNGVRCIEHGIELDDECIMLMQKYHVPVITTLYISHMVASSDAFPDYMREKARAAVKNHCKSMQRAKEAGLCIAYGTDFGNSALTPYLGNGRELTAIVNAGFTPMEAIQIATYNSACAIRHEKEIGSLEAGKRADIIIANGDPLENISVLTDAAHILFVMQDGVIKKNEMRNEAYGS